jgi:hypothetical protein
MSAEDVGENLEAFSDTGNRGKWDVSFSAQATTTPKKKSVEMPFCYTVKPMPCVSNR